MLLLLSAEHQLSTSSRTMSRLRFVVLHVSLPRNAKYMSLSPRLYFGGFPNLCSLPLLHNHGLVTRIWPYLAALLGGRWEDDTTGTETYRLYHSPWMLMRFIGST